VKILSKLRERNIVFSGFVAIIILFFLLHRLVIKKPGTLEAFSSLWTYPLVALQNKIITPFKQRLAARKTTQSTAERLRLLEKENEDLTARVVQLEALELFAKKTKHLRNFEKRYVADHMQLCQIIMHRFTVREHAFFVNAGFRHGITKNMAAVYKNNIIGKVEHVYPYYSKVLAITDKRCKVSAYSSITKTAGIFQGTNNAKTALLTHVDRLKKVRKNEMVISSGEGTIFPRGFGLGKIVSFKPSGVYNTITVEPLVNPQDMEYCYLLKKGAATES